MMPPIESRLGYRPCRSLCRSRCLPAWQTNCRSGPQWSYEVTWDGYRCLAEKRGYASSCIAVATHDSIGKLEIASNKMGVIVSHNSFHQLIWLFPLAYFPVKK